MEPPFSRPITAAEAGMRLDVFLARQPEVGTRVRAKELIEQGYVSIQGQKAKPGRLTTRNLRMSPPNSSSRLTAQGDITR